MQIAYTSAPGKGDMDLLLHGLAKRLEARGLRVCGAVQINTDCGDGLCDMDLTILPDGPELRISQSLGRGARGCRLDPDALERAVGLVSAGLGKGADLLIVNKFGKREGEGGGFRNVIADALGAGIPVIVGLNRLNHEAFFTFTDGLAVEVAPEGEALEAWAVAAATETA